MLITRRTVLATAALPLVRSWGQSNSVVSSGGLLSVELTAAPATLTIAGRSVRVLAYNDSVPGPTLVVTPGDTVHLKLRNNLDRDTNLHFHGLHMPPTGTGDDVFRHIPPGEDGDYAFSIPTDHPTGTFWYHPHIHHDTAYQVSSGLSGLILIRGIADTLMSSATEHTLVLHDWAIGSDGALLTPSAMEIMRGREGQTITVNGNSRPAFTIRRNGAVRLRMLNASASRFYRLQVEGHTMHIVATSGGAVSQPRAVSEYLLVPGERLEVLIQGNNTPGAYRLLSLPYSRLGMMGGGAMMETSRTLTLATLEYSGSSDTPVAVPARIAEVAPLPSPARKRTFVLRDGMGGGMGMGMGMGMRMGGGAMTINDLSFDPNRIDADVQLGDVEDWEFQNAGMMDHPMHLHVNPFQVQSPAEPDPAWRDTVLVPRGQSRTFRVRFAEHTGKTVYHCHILDHEDMGMMGVLRVNP